MVAACARCRGKYGCKARMDARQVWMQVKPSRWRGAVKCPTKRLQQVCNKETPTKRLISTECVLFPIRCQCATRFWISWKVHALVYLSPTFLEFGTTFPQQYGAFYSAQLSNFCTTLFTFVACLHLSNFVPFFFVVCVWSAFRLSHHSNLAHVCCHISRNWHPLLSQRAIKHTDDTHTNKICCGSLWAAHERNWITTRWFSLNTI